MPELPESARENASDPHRWVRRHHYQEGPGFLFLATQGGRPEGDAPRPSPLVRVRLRMRAVQLSREVGVDSASHQLGCGRSALYKWLAAFDAEGIVGRWITLGDRTGCGRPSPLGSIR